MSAPSRSKTALASINIHSGLGTLSSLPIELRIEIYKELLVCPTPWIEGYTCQTGISTTFLATSRQVYDEALFFLYHTPHIFSLTRPLTIAPLPPLFVMVRFKHLTFHVHYHTSNRGAAETHLSEDKYVAILAQTDPLALTLLHSTALETLTIKLLNSNQRKTGPIMIRLPQFLQQMRRILLPFSHLEESVVIQVMGSETYTWWEMMDQLKMEHLKRIKMHGKERERDILMSMIMSGP